MSAAGALSGGVYAVAAFSDAVADDAAGAEYSLVWVSPGGAPPDKIVARGAGTRALASADLAVAPLLGGDFLRRSSWRIPILEAVRDALLRDSADAGADTGGEGTGVPDLGAVEARLDWGKASSRIEADADGAAARTVAALGPGN